VLVRLDERNSIGRLLNELGLVGVGAEIGALRGDFSEEILRVWTGKKLLLVDAWRHLSDYLDSWNFSDEEMEEHYRFAKKRLAPFGDRVSIIRELSDRAAITIQDESLDFIYIDANHSYAAVRKDLESWYPKLRPGGLMSGHDYFDAQADADLEPILASSFVAASKNELTSYGVKSAVDEFAERLGVKLFVTPETFPTWLFLKPK